METIVWKFKNNEEDEVMMDKAGATIRSGGLVAFPTETVYGLGGNALDTNAAKKIYSAKGRPSDNPLIVHIADKKVLYDIVSRVPKNAEKLMEKFWPGPLTLIFKKKDIIPKEVSGGLDTVAVRCPSHPAAIKFIKSAKVPIAAPSANLSGKPSPTCAGHVLEDLSGRIDMIIDAGDVGLGIESTIVDVASDIPTILRPGFVTRSMIENVIGKVSYNVKAKDDESPKAPGMKYRHYAPKGELSLYRGSFDKVSEVITNKANKKNKSGSKVGVLICDEHEDIYKKTLNPDITLISLGSAMEPEKIAGKLFGALRQFDNEKCEYIYGETFTEDGVGEAVMNRLMKAAGYNLTDV